MSQKSLQLKKQDYIRILDFYKESIPKSKRTLKRKATKLIAKKLCRCVKKFNKQNEDRAIGICTKSIVQRKGFQRGKFTCKKKPTIVLRRIKKTRRV